MLYSLSSLFQSMLVSSSPSMAMPMAMLSTGLSAASRESSATALVSAGDSMPSQLEVAQSASPMIGVELRNSAVLSRRSAQERGALAVK